jgi:glycine oxidase
MLTSVSPDVIVVGGGAIGTAIAYQLAKGGVRLMLFERGQLGGGATGASAGMIVAQQDRSTPEPFAVLSRESARLYGPLAEELLDRTGLDIGYRRAGLVRVAFDDVEAHQLREQRAWDGDHGLTVSWLEPAAALDVEPALSPAIRAALYYSDEHHVMPHALAQALGRAAADLGAVLREGTSVDRLVVEGGRVTGVRLGDETVYASQVVLANGAWASAWSDPLRAQIPVRPVRGQMLALRTTGTALHSLVTAQDGYVLSKADRSTFVGTTVEEAGFDARPTAAGIAGLLVLASRLVPRLGEASFLRAWAGLRPGTPDGVPLLGRLPERNVILATGHFRNGILLAPITAELVADLVARRAPRLPLEAFDPTRFLVRAA